MWSLNYNRYKLSSVKAKLSHPKFAGIGRMEDYYVSDRFKL